MTHEKNEKTEAEKEVELVKEMMIKLMSLNNSLRMYSVEGSVRVSHNKDNTRESKPPVGQKSTLVIIYSETASCNVVLAAS